MYIDRKDVEDDWVVGGKNERHDMRKLDRRWLAKSTWLSLVWIILVTWMSIPLSNQEVYWKVVFSKIYKRKIIKKLYFDCFSLSVLTFLSTLILYIHIFFLLSHFIFFFYLYISKCFINRWAYSFIHVGLKILKNDVFNRCQKI